MERSHICDETDVWTGLASAEERRRRQNRLHQRAYRSFAPRSCILKHALTSLGQRRHLKRLERVVAIESAPIPLTDTNRIATSTTTAISDMPIFYLLRCAGINDRVKEFLEHALATWSIGAPLPRDLPTVGRLNAFNALARNAQILHISVELLESDEDASPLFSPPEEGGIALPAPAHLAPTFLQRSVRHHPWLDLLPFPQLRDNILLYLHTSQINEEDMITELICGCLDLAATDEASMIVWADPWDAAQWEFSPSFFVRWGFLLQGCQDMIQTTNLWRSRRSAPRLEFIMN
jgi:hypothetical protein